MAINATNYDGTKDYQIAETKEILDSKEAIMANATGKMIAGGLALKTAFEEMANRAEVLTTESGKIIFNKVPNRQMWVFFAQRYSVVNTIILLGCFYELEKRWVISEIKKDEGMTYITNDQGTVEFNYNGSTYGVFAGAIRLH